MLRLSQTSVLNICFSHVAPPQTPKGKANEQCARKTKRLSRAAAAACPCPQRLTGRELAVHHCTSCAVSCFFSSSARAVQPKPDQPALHLYGTHAAPAPPPCRSRAAIVSFRPACPQTREPWACMAACGWRVAERHRDRERDERKRLRQKHTERRQQKGERTCTQCVGQRPRCACVDISALRSRGRGLKSRRTCVPIRCCC